MDTTTMLYQRANEVRDRHALETAIRDREGAAYAAYRATTEERARTTGEPQRLAPPPWELSTEGWVSVVFPSGWETGLLSREQADDVVRTRLAPRLTPEVLP